MMFFFSVCSFGSMYMARAQRCCNYAKHWHGIRLIRQTEFVLYEYERVDTVYSTR